MMNVATPLKVAVIALSFACLASPVIADSGKARIIDASPKMLKVESNGQDYTKLDLLGNFTIVGKLEFDTGIAGKVKSWQAFPTITNGYGPAAKIPNMVTFKQSASYPFLQRPHLIAETLYFSIPGHMVQNAAVAMCNLKADTLRAQGKPNSWIFNQHQHVHFRLGLEASVDSTGPWSNNQHWSPDLSPHVFEVRCEKWNGAQVPLYGDGMLTNKPQRVWEIAPKRKRLRLKSRR